MQNIKKSIKFGFLIAVVVTVILLLLLFFNQDNIYNNQNTLKNQVQLYSASFFTLTNPWFIISLVFVKSFLLGSLLHYFVRKFKHYK